MQNTLTDEQLEKPRRLTADDILAVVIITCDGQKYRVTMDDMGQLVGIAAKHGDAASTEYTTTEADEGGGAGRPPLTEAEEVSGKQGTPPAGGAGRRNKGAAK